MKGLPLRSTWRLLGTTRAQRGFSGARARRRRGNIGALLLGVAQALSSAQASAYHLKETPPTYLTGHVLPRGDFRLGLDSVGYGLTKRLSLNTQLGGFLLPAITGDFAPNLAVRVGALKLDPVFVAVEVGVTYLMLSNAHEKVLGDALGGSLETEMWMVPLMASVSYHPGDRLLLSADLSYFMTQNLARAATDFGNGTAMLASDSLQGGFTGQLALSRVFAFTLKVRGVFWAPKIPFHATGEQENLSVDLRGNFELSTLAGAFQVVPGVAFSWNVFNLRLGVGYGNLFIPTLGLVSGYQGLIPDAELYFQF